MYLSYPRTRIYHRARLPLTVALSFGLMAAFGPLNVFSKHISPTLREGTTCTVNSLGDTPDIAPGNGTCADSLGSCLAALANNGGLTHRIALLVGSPAIDAGDNCVLNNSSSPTLPSGIRTDPRGIGFFHSLDGNGDGISKMDIGSYEAGTAVVTNTADSGEGSLRQAILDTNANPSVDTISFQTGLTGTITLLSALPDLSTSMTITGPGENRLTVRRSAAVGTPDFRIFTINSGATVNISGFTIANGHTAPGVPGGGIFNSGSLMLSNCIITDNTTGAGADFAAGGYGGGIYSAGQLSLISSTVRNNQTGQGGSGSSAGYGGGVFLQGPGAMMNSTINGNLTGSGGAAAGAGGGIFNGSTLSLTNCTVSGNRTGIGTNGMGAGILNSGTLTLVSSTVTANITGAGRGGGVYDVGTFTLKNTIVADNRRINGTGTDASDIDGSVDGLSSFNLIGDGTSMFGLSNGVNGNLVGTSLNPINARLGSLSDNGGPTQTHALLPGSPALDAGDNALVVNPPFNGPPFSDQRGAGFVRIADGPDSNTTQTVDIGAFEAEPSLEDIPDQLTNEDTQFSFSFNVGDAAMGSLSLNASSSNQILVPNGNLIIGDTGSERELLIIPSTNQSGTATITVTIEGSNGQVMTDTFGLTVTPVNDAPTFMVGADQVVSEDAGPRTVGNWATGISPGPNESGQLVSFLVTNNTNPSLFSAGPSISPSGTLTFTPASNANGTASITVLLQDNGGIANGGHDTSASQNFMITVTSVNDAPVNSLPGAQSTIQHTPLVFSAANSNRISIADVDAADAPVRVTLSAVQGTITLGTITGLTFVVGDGTDDITMTFTGTITSINADLNGIRFQPAMDFSGNAALQIITNDQGATGSGGPQIDTDSVSITVISGGVLEFSSPTYALDENGGIASITVIRHGGSAGATSVDYNTSNGTATGGGACGSGSDYVTTSGSLQWADGDTSPKTFNVPLCDDSSNEPDETLNLELSHATGSASLGTLVNSQLTIINDDAPILLTEENTDHAVALDDVSLTADPFTLTNQFNLSTDTRRRVSIFAWRLGLLPTDDASSVHVYAEDDQGRTYLLPVEYAGSLEGVNDVTHIIIRLPESVIGAPRDLWLTVMLRGPGSNRARIRIAAP